MAFCATVVAFWTPVVALIISTDVVALFSCDTVAVAVLLSAELVAELSDFADDGTSVVVISLVVYGPLVLLVAVVSVPTVVFVAKTSTTLIIEGFKHMTGIY